MNLIEFFNSDCLELPKTYGTSDFETALELMFAEYLAALTELSGPDPVTDDIKRSVPVIEGLCTAIREAVGCYLDGFPHLAFDKLARGLEKIEHPWLDGLASLPDISEAVQFLYRVRSGPTAIRDRKDLFHIPFESRHLVSTQRYSIPGLPSLYLGGSLWLCWEELEQPPFEAMHVARFRAAPGARIRVLDFGWRPALIAALIDHDPQVLGLPQHAGFIASQSVCWPLIAACSVKVRYSRSPFVPEYVVPQMVLQWVRLSKGFDGIRYFSTKIDQYVDDPGAVSNFVFPAKRRAANGHCAELREKFVVSEPASWTLLKATDLVGGGRRPPTWKLELVRGTAVSYLHTDFWAIENKVDGLPCGPV